MRLLLDTHVLIWWAAGAPRLGSVAQRAIAAADTDLFVSAASWWELAIKKALGQVDFEFKVARRALSARAVMHLPVTADHAEAMASLPPIHRDPFDRMLVAQAQVESLVLLTRDRALKAYGDSVLVI